MTILINGKTTESRNKKLNFVSAKCLPHDLGQVNCPSFSEPVFLTYEMLDICHSYLSHRKVGKLNIITYVKVYYKVLKTAKYYCNWVVRTVEGNEKRDSPEL